MAALAEAFEDERDSPGPRGAAQRGDANDDEMDPHALLGVWAEQGASLLTMLSQVRHPRPRETNPVPDAICRGRQHPTNGSSARAAISVALAAVEALVAELPAMRTGTRAGME